MPSIWCGEALSNFTCISGPDPTVKISTGCWLHNGSIKISKQDQRIPMKVSKQSSYVDQMDINPNIRYFQMLLKQFRKAGFVPVIHVYE